MSKPTYSDKELLEMIRRGGTDRINGLEFIYRYSGWVPLALAILKKQKVQHANAKDAIQEAIIVLDNNVRNFQFKEKGTLKNYFISICKGRIYSNKRSIKRQVLKGESNELDSKEDNTPEVVMLKEEQKVIIRKLLEKIGEPCTTVMTLYYLSYSMKEIAAVIEKSEGIAKKMSFTCRKKLRKLLNQTPHLLSLLNF